MTPESDKWGWKHVSVFGGFEKGSGTKRWKCNHCNLRYNGSYSRVRAHLLGFSGVGVKGCPAIDKSVREAFQALEEERLARKKKRISGAEKPGKRIKTSRPSSTCVSKEDVDDIVARFFYAIGLNVNVVNSRYFRDMTKAIASYGHRYELPSIDELSDSFLSKEKGRIEKSVALVRESWPHTGCTILCVGRLESMVDCLHIDIFVSSPRGVVFLKAVDVNDIDGADSPFVGVLGDVIMDVGSTNVLQIVSHLEHANQLSDSLILAKFPYIFLSPCTSYSIRMLMEEIAELDWVKSVVLCAKQIEQCVIAYKQFSPSMFSQNPKGSCDPLSSKFAPFFCIVQRIFEVKQLLKEVVASDEWKQWKLNHIPEQIKNVEAAISEDSFWRSANLLLQLLEPFVRMLGTLDIDKFVMGDICNWRVQALEAARNKGIDSATLNQLEELMENRWDGLFSPLHAAGYILNPRYFGRGQAKDKVVMRAWKTTVERYESESGTRRLLREQLSSYWRLEGSLGDEDAVDCRDKMDPVAWWENFGFETPHLQTLAIKVLSQVSSVTMCREICQDNGFPYGETANRLGVDRVEDLVFVQKNLRIHSQKNGLPSFPSGARNVNSSSQSGVRILECAQIDLEKATGSIDGKL